MNDLPCSPIACMALSITNAALAIYPLPSRKVMKNIMAKITGTNTITNPTPAITPSVASDTVHSGAWIKPSIASVHLLNGPCCHGVYPIGKWCGKIEGELENNPHGSKEYGDAQKPVQNDFINFLCHLHFSEFRLF